MLRASGHQLPLLTAEAETGSREWEDFSFVVAADTQLGTAQNIALILGFSIFVSCSSTDTKPSPVAFVFTLRFLAL